jgi:hypothetical protein
MLTATFVWNAHEIRCKNVANNLINNMCVVLVILKVITYKPRVDDMSKDVTRKYLITFIKRLMEIEGV